MRVSVCVLFSLALRLFFDFVRVCLWTCWQKVYGGVIALGVRSHNPNWHLDGCLMNGAGPAAPSCGKANIKTNLVFLSTCLDMSVAVCSCMQAYVSICLRVCTRIRQLRDWAPGIRTTFADLPLTGPNVLLQRGFIHSPPGKKKKSRVWLRRCWWCWWQAVQHHRQINDLSVHTAIMC